MSELPGEYVVAPVVALQCPRCGQARDAPLVAELEGAVQFGAVCSTPIEGGGYCSTSLQLTATAHVFPAS